eukprot:TRINITY_DN40245_c0_g1_i2.p1 TRINITY_DN40245_c0_g1~~TRINITY_DN40245_c0_g1_i2.p1  ORF type:complete len:507 (-),score=100.98 TRINITY_DN40245_c0_g1_i2:91-1611(-)
MNGGGTDTEDSKSEALHEDEVPSFIPPRHALDPDDIPPRLPTGDHLAAEDLKFRKSVQLIRATSAEAAPETIGSDGEPASPPLPTHPEHRDSPRVSKLHKPSSPRSGAALSLRINAATANAGGDDDDDDLEKKKQPSPLRLTVASLSGQESTTSADDVNLIAIPSPRFKGDSLNNSFKAQPSESVLVAQDSLPSPKFRETESKAFAESMTHRKSAPHLRLTESASLVSQAPEVSVIVGKADSSPPVLQHRESISVAEEQKGKQKKHGKSVQFQFDEVTMLEAEKREKAKPGKSILKKLASPRTKVRVQKKEEEIMLTVKTLSVGSIMVKYSTKGVPSKRIFRVSDDGTELLWKKSRGFYTKFELATVKVMIVGPRTQPFAKYEWKTARPWNCFSLIAEHRTVDIECLSKDQFNTWYFGLLNLVPLNYNNMDKAQVLWRVALYKTVQISLQCRMPVNDVWHRLVKEAREDLKKETNEMNDVVRLASVPLSPKSQKFVQALDTTSKAI